jgi:hypothetical protein
MSLPILDGNQSATTLSTILSGGEHTPAHTVVSLGSTAISNITSAVSGSVVSISNFPATQTIAGTVTASLADVTDPLQDNGTSGKSVAVKIYDLNGLPIGPQSRIPVSGSVTLGIGTSQIGTVTVGALPSGSLTTRFGSVVTANLATITSAVTNASRKFLLVQNIATSTVTIGIGFSPTTTQGIQLAAGAGLTFDAFCPTGAVYWLSGVTGSNWSVLEG